MMQSMLGEETILVDLRRDRRPDLTEAEAVLVGGSIYGGRIQPDLIAFCESHREELLSRPVGLFITCLLEGDQAREELNSNFPSWLRAHAFASLPLGGQLRVKNLKFIDRLITKRVAKQTEDVDTLDAAAIEALCAAAERAISS
jgi:menaquinone-dependent protoporphyrinogen oxidase